jgi:hypothetical protein
MAKKRLTAAEKRAAAELKMWESLRPSEPVERDVPVPDPGSYVRPDFSVGWDFYFDTSFNRVSVYRAWSTYRLHGKGEIGPTWSDNGSQGALALYSTEELALRGARREVARRAAELLFDLDNRIDARVKHRETQDKLSASLEKPE